MTAIRRNFGFIRIESEKLPGTACKASRGHYMFYVPKVLSVPRRYPMARSVVGGLIQMSNPINDESVAVADVAEAMLEKHIPMIEEAGKKAFRSSVFRRCLTGLISVPVKTSAGMTWQNPAPDPPQSALLNMHANMKWC